MILSNGGTAVHALDYYRRGWSIIRIAVGTKKPLRGLGWKCFQAERPDEAKIRKWFGNGRAYDIAVILGEVSGNLVCRDFDERLPYQAWAELHSELADSLPTVQTARGFHVYFRVADFANLRALMPDGVTILDLGNGELRAGGYCVLPESRHPSGHVYRWIIPPTDEIRIVDPVEAGFLKAVGHATERTERHRDHRSKLKQSEAIKSVHGEIRSNVLSRLDASTMQAIEAAIRATLPTGPRRRNRQVFEFARSLKAIPALSVLDVQDVEPLVREWHRLSLPFILTKPFEETWIDFLKAWPRVKFPKGQDAMNEMFSRAIAAELPAFAQRYEGQRMQLLVKLCRELQRSAADGVFFLSCRTAAGYLGTDPRTISRWLFLLVSDRVLEIVSKGSESSWKATRFRYLAELRE